MLNVSLKMQTGVGWALRLCQLIETMLNDSLNQNCHYYVRLSQHNEIMLNVSFNHHTNTKIVLARH